LVDSCGKDSHTHTYTHTHTIAGILFSYDWWMVMYQLIAFFLGTLAVFNERLHKQKITCVRACMRAGVVGDGEGGGVNVPSAYRFGQNHIYTVHIRYF